MVNARYALKKVGNGVLVRPGPPAPANALARSATRYDCELLY